MTTFATARVDANAPPIGVAVSVTAAVASPVNGNAYQLYCQYVLHIGKGQVGPMLAFPSTVASEITLVREITASGTTAVMFDGVFDVTRQHLSGRSHLPKVQPGDYNQTAFIRVEPHIYDVAASKYLTPPKTPAVIIVASVGSNGRVDAVRSLGGWLLERANAQLDPVETVAKLQDLDAYDTYANGVDDAIHQTLQSPSVPVETKVAYLGTIERQTLMRKENYNLLKTIEALAAGDASALKAAAERRLAQLPQSR